MPCPCGKAVKIEVLIKRPGNPEPEIVDADDGEVPAADGRTEDPRIDDPGAAAADAVARGIFSFSVRPRRAIARGTLVAVMPDVLHPLPDVAVHVVKTPGVRRIGAHLAGLTDVQAVVRVLGRDRIAERIAGCRPGRGRARSRSRIPKRLFLALNSATKAWKMPPLRMVYGQRPARHPV
jgi:hypothetical protein